MKRVGQNRSYDDQIAYHEADGRAPEFDKEHPERVGLARSYIDAIFRIERRPLTIWELGCGAGDITGPYSNYHGVVGVDVTKGAAEAIPRRWPNMTFLLSPVERLQSADCDILVMTEFLEHVDDPELLVLDWMPRAKYAVLGHPLYEPDPPNEPGHIWSYDLVDWQRWFEMGGHEKRDSLVYSMGSWPEMVLGWSSRR